MAEAQPSTSAGGTAAPPPWANLPVDSRGKIGVKFQFEDDRKENVSCTQFLLRSSLFDVDKAFPIDQNSRHSCALFT